MRIHLASAAMAAAVFSATAASATTFAGSYTVSAHTSGSGLLIQTQDLTPGPGTGFGFDLSSLGQIADVNLFDIWTNEASVEGDDLSPKSISITFDFTAPNPIQDGSVGGVTGAYTFFGLVSGGYVNWANGGNQTFNFGNGGQLAVHLDNATFNSGPFLNLDEGYSERATVTAEFSLNSLSAAVPEPATWGMMIMGFGLAGAVLRRRRSALTAFA
jgi:hypothetical protein